MRDVKDAVKRIISLGGGVQSTAMCVLAVQGKLDDIMGGPVDAAVFAHLGDDSENPETIEYMDSFLAPWCSENGLLLDVVQRHVNGRPVTLFGTTTSLENRSIGVPVRGLSGNPGRRKCTVDFKINVVHGWLRENGVDTKPRGVTHGRSKVSLEQVDEIRRLSGEGFSQRKIAADLGIPKSTVGDILGGKTWRSQNSFGVVAIGISTDEIERLNRKKYVMPAQESVYPLIELGIDREGCKKIIADAGLPVPPKSACYFCPFHKLDYWYEMKRDRPELFEKAVSFELMLNSKKEFFGDESKVFLSRGGLSLDRIVERYEETVATDGVFNDGECDEGYCWT